MESDGQRLGPRFRVIIADDPGHEKVFAEIHYNNKFLAMVSQEDGPADLKVELSGLDLDESQVIGPTPHFAKVHKKDEE